MSKEKEQLDDKELEKINGGVSAARSKGGKNIYKCDFCGEEFTKKTDLNNHMRNLHKGL